MLVLLKESVATRHSERLEQVIIVLIAMEIGQFFFPTSRHRTALILTWI